LIARTDIVEVVGSRVPLTKAGREYKACCPFHTEKTASFWVSPEKQFYYCFGCGAHGTALRFLMDYDHMTFPEAVEDLAARLGLTVPHEGGGGTDPRDTALYDLMGRVAGLYAQRLAHDPRARRYLTERGLSTEVVQRFGLGYAPDAWDTLLTRFGTGESERHALLQAGLIIERERVAGAAERHYDRFRDRIMFPIRDSRGRVIAFGGRVIDRGEPKYLNSPETSLFHKGRELYGLYESRSGGTLERLLVVEGYMDVVRLHQAGITYAVATLGTATTTEHLKRIFRLVRAVVFAFDGDRAGRAAAWRALQHALPEAREGREIRFLFLPDGHDPDTLVGEEGREAFERRLEAALPLSEYLVRELSSQSDLAHADGRARLAEAARPLIAQVPPGVYRELLIARIAEVVGLPAPRLAELWHSGAAAPEATAVPSPPPRTARSAGRGGLVRQALARLVRFPATAAAVTDAERDALTRCEEPGADLLRAVLDDLRSQPLQISAQVIERWRDRPGGEHLTRLLEREAMLEDPAAATVELQAALRKLAARVREQRLKVLETKSKTSRLSDEELKEIQELTTERPLQGERPPER
jgi:DNA primase